MHRTVILASQNGEDMEETQSTESEMDIVTLVVNLHQLQKPVHSVVPVIGKSNKAIYKLKLYLLLPNT